MCKKCSIDIRGWSAWPRSLRKPMRERTKEFRALLRIDIGALVIMPPLSVGSSFILKMEAAFYSGTSENMLYNIVPHTIFIVTAERTQTPHTSAPLIGIRNANFSI
jgi:hypothetical protein